MVELKSLRNLLPIELKSTSIWSTPTRFWRPTYSIMLAKKPMKKLLLKLLWFWFPSQLITLRNFGTPKLTMLTVWTEKCGWKLLKISRNYFVFWRNLKTEKDNIKLTPSKKIINFTPKLTLLNLFLLSSALLLLNSTRPSKASNLNLKINATESLIYTNY